MAETNSNGNRTNTTPKLLGGVTGKGFVKNDPRINRKGRPKNFDHFRALAIAVANGDTQRNGKKMSCAEAMLRDWKDSPEPSLQKAFAEYAFGKVPDKIETTGLENRTTLILNYADENKSENRSRVPPTVSLGSE
jgi:hypothetical protein